MKESERENEREWVTVCERVRGTIIERARKSD